MLTAVYIVSLIGGGLSIFFTWRNRNRLQKAWKQASWLMWLGATKERWRAWWNGETVAPTPKPKRKHPLRPWLDE